MSIGQYGGRYPPSDAATYGLCEACGTPRAVRWTVALDEPHGSQAELYCPECERALPARTCGYCGQAQRGYAAAGAVALCHPHWPKGADDDCYRMVTVYHRPLLDGRVWPW